MKTEIIYPFFCASTISLVVGFYFLVPRVNAYVQAHEQQTAQMDASAADSAQAVLASAEAPQVEPALEIPSLDDYSLATYPEMDDQILTDYRSAWGRQHVIDWFSTKVCSSTSLAEQILVQADAFNIDPSLAFALAWEESRFDPTAENKMNKNGSIDRGIFQLNNRSFPKLSVQEFFNPAINAHYAMAHLAWCLEKSGTLVSGLAMYNAGWGKVSKDNTPKRTLDYSSRILKTQAIIEQSYLKDRIIHDASSALPATVALAPAADASAANLADADATTPRQGYARLGLFALSSAQH
jgi:soluble lytic murein transglycosylase-like protein